MTEVTSKKHIKIAACYIVKNEEKNLPFSMGTVKQIADELIVVDTGSSDATKKIALENGARVYDFAWQDDFATARNYAIEQVSSDVDWIIFLDADEGFVLPERVRAAIEKVDAIVPSVDAVMVPLIEIDVSNGGEEIGRERSLRIFRHKENLRYRNRIHENVCNLDGELSLHYDDGDLTCYHTGYSASIVEEKVKRNLRFIQQDIQEHGEQPWHYIFLSDCYMGLHDYEAALRYGLMALDSSAQAVAGRSGVYHNVIESMRQTEKPLGAMIAIAERAIAEFPSMPEFYGERGMILSAQGRLDEARASLMRAMELYERGKSQALSQHEDAYFTDGVAAIVCARLGEIEALMGDDARADEWFRRAMSYDGTNDNVMAKYEKFKMKAGALAAQKQREVDAAKNKSIGAKTDNAQDDANGNRDAASEKLRIAAAYIVKNEARTLAKSIESMKGAYDELVVVDTGSTDDTIGIAHSHGARVVHFDWCDDFSAARNFALEQISADADWVIFLDGDEYFTDETRTNIRAAIEKYDRQQKNLLLIKWCNYDIDTGAHLVDVMTPRIFRVTPSIRYAGRIHEQLRENGGDVTGVALVPESKLKLIHTGYSSSLSREKAERNLRIIKEEMAASETPEAYYMALAECYDGLDDDGAAIYYAKKDIARGRQSLTYASRSYRILMRRLAASPARVDERGEVVRRAVQDFPELPEFHAELAECLAYDGAYDEAVAEAEAAEKIMKDIAAGKRQSIEPVQFDDEMMATLVNRKAVWQRLADRKQSIRIAACVIVKNEEKNIGQWLTNVKCFADEIVVVDTGSADRTRDIVLAAKRESDVKIPIKLIDFVWDDDFSDAKNHAIAAVSDDVDWIVFLDADETFYAPNHVRGVIAYVDECHHDADIIRAMKVDIDADNGEREVHRFLDIRIFRHSPDIFYQGIVHENIVKRRPDGSVTTDIVMYDEPYRLNIRHTGYSSSKIHEKAARNLKLLEAEIAQQGGRADARQYRYLAESYFILGKFEASMKFAHLALESRTQGLGTGSDMEYLLLQCMRSLDFPMRERLKEAKRGAERFPNVPDYYGEAGILLARMGRIDEAQENLKRAEEIFANQCDGREASYYESMRGDVMAALARVYREKGQMTMSENTAVEALKADRYNEDALNEFADAQGDIMAEDLAMRLLPFFDDDEKDLTFLARWAEASGRMRLYLVMCVVLREKYKKEMPRQALYQKALSGDYAGLYDDVVKGLVEAFPQLIISLILLEQEETQEARELSDRLFSLLPDGAAAAWDAYRRGAVPSPNDDINLMMKEFVAYGSDEQLVRFVVRDGVSSADMVKVAHAAQADARWSAAFMIYAGVPQGAPEVTARFWTDTGICCYYLREWESAAQCFDAAEKLDGANLAEINSYRKWMAEQQNDGAQNG